jgi:hypothetical protein
MMDEQYMKSHLAWSSGALFWLLCSGSDDLRFVSDFALIFFLFKLFCFLFSSLLLFGKHFYFATGGSFPKSATGLAL